MSGIEIERKFWVKPTDAYKQAAFAHHRMKQGYIPCQTATVRVRTKDRQAFLTIKARSTDGGVSRYEFEQEIAFEEAEQLFKLCRGGMIDKTRYLVKSGEHVFEIDEFYGDNQGLVIAEVELQRADEPYVKPDFVGREVTGDRRFYNACLLTNPYKLWKETLEHDE